MNELKRVFDLPMPLQIAIGIATAALLVLLVITLTVWWRTPADQIRWMPKWMWLLAIFGSQPLGPTLFLVIGRTTAPVQDSAKSRSENHDVADVLYGKSNHQ